MDFEGLLFLSFATLEVSEDAFGCYGYLFIIYLFGLNVL